MTALREQIAKILGQPDDIICPCDTCQRIPKQVDKILAIIKEAGYVKLADNQGDSSQALIERRKTVVNSKDLPGALGRLSKAHKNNPFNTDGIVSIPAYEQKDWQRMKPPTPVNGESQAQ